MGQKKENTDQIFRLAWAELSTMRLLDILPSRWEGARLATAATTVYDINGEELYLRFPFSSRATSECAQGDAGYADIASNPALGEALLAFGQDAAWNEEEVREQAFAAAREHCDLGDWCFFAASFAALSLSLCENFSIGRNPS